MRDLPGREAEVAEDDVLDARVQERVAVRRDGLRLLADEVEDHGEVVHAERPERVLVAADDAEVLAVRVHAQELAELAGVEELLQLEDARVVQQQMAGHEHEAALTREPQQLLHLGALHRRRLLDEHVLARLERLLRERVVGRHRRRDDDGVELVVGEQLVEVGRHPRLRMPCRELLPQLLRGVAEPRELGELVEVADEVLPPVAEADLADASH